MKTVHWRANDPELKWVSNFDWGSGLYHPMLRKFWACFFHDDFPNRGKDVYREYTSQIRAIVSPERLLEYQVNSGWGPLCQFLGHDVPDTRFPRSNDTDAFVDRCRKRNHNQMMNVAFRALVVGVPVIAAAVSASVAMTRFAPGFGRQLTAAVSA